MDVIDQAVYDLIHNFKSAAGKTGAPALSSCLYTDFGYPIKPGTLMNKANPDQPHQITVRESILIQKIQHKHNLLYAQAHVFNYSLVKLGGFEATNDIEFLNTYTRLHSDLGKLATVINDAFSDGKISREEVNKVKHKSMAAIRAILEMESRINSICDEPKHNVDCYA